MLAIGGIAKVAKIGVNDGMHIHPSKGVSPT